MPKSKNIIPMADSSKEITANDVKPTVLPDAYHDSAIATAFSTFHLPRYRELPGMTLYREQVIDYIEDLLHPLSPCIEGTWLTPSMVNNYVKMGLVPSPVKKQYGREHIARLITICIFKQIVPIAAIESLFTIQKYSYHAEQAFDYIGTELEAGLHAAFSMDGQKTQDTAKNVTRESLLVRSAITAFVSKAYLMGYLTYTDI